jgi:hypothetical protein
MMNSGVQSEADRVKIEKLTTVLVRLSTSFTSFVNPLENYGGVSSLYE